MLPNTDSDSDFSDEVEFLHETHKGQEVIILSDDEGEDSLEPATANQSDEPFRFLDLAAELRVQILQYLLPHDLTLTGSEKNGQPRWIVSAAPKESKDTQHPVKKSAPRDWQYMAWQYYEAPMRKEYLSADTQLFLVSKFVSNEARAVLYGSNTFTFTVDGNSHAPVSLRSPDIFGPFGSPIRLPLLRNLRNINIDVVLDCNSHWAVKRQRARLEYFVAVLKEHADDENQKSMLQKLKIEVKLVSPTRDIHHNLSRPPKECEKFMFGLESMASLRNIKDVQFTGLPEWYAKCLQLCIQGKGGEVQETHWPLVEVKRRDSSKKKILIWVTTRKWYQPTLNWKEFAERNDVPIPADIDKFWMAHN